MKTKLLLNPGWDGWCRLHKAPQRGEERPERWIHTHDELELNIGVSGKGRYLIDGRSFDIGYGTLLWLSPEQAHLLVDESQDFRMWVAVIRARGIKKEKSDRRFCVQPTPDEVVFLAELCRQLAATKQREQFNAGIRFLFMRAEEMIERFECDDAALHPAVTRATRFMKHMVSAPSVNHVSRQAGMSRSQLSRVFKKQTGLTLVEYRQSMQLERFLFLYGAGTKRNLMESALEAGFGSYIQFHRVFQRRFHCGPREYFSTIKP
ncbi:MAG: helix-turn-helix transcriptional regulator [Kiritimatiellaceae bacterium]|nr:helix-turn-helix transcriptional regulator [Kiritimatiellaceae bacterium]